MIATIKSSAVVIDAGLGILQVIADPRSGEAENLWSRWIDEGLEVCAPSLWLHEATSVLHKIYMQHLIREESSQKALEALLSLDLTLYDPTPESCKAAYHWSTRLNQHSAYDGFYLVLAERLDCTFWTTDQRLANRARQLGVTWVHCLGE
jgi:predicted nucleic acid-binding protein